LLVGPPGTGKTLLARAVAGEARVPFFSINGSEFVELYVGLGAARVRDLFDQARKQAPCILFIDEIDALGKSRVLGRMGTGSNDEKEQTLNQLLAEMDGFDPSEGVIMLAATNRPEILDPALLRAGRFDRQILLNNPDQLGRQQILAVHVTKIKFDPEADLKNVASLTSGFSGADLANLVNEAALVATRRGGDAVSEEDFTQAIERIVAGIEQKGKVINAKEKVRIAYHELGHVTVAMDLGTIDKVHKVSVIPRGMGALGYTLQRPTEDRYVLDEDELLNKVAVLLGGRAAEKLFLSTVSTGAANDLAKATDLARAMVSQFGMSEKMGMVSYEGGRSPYLQSPFENLNRILSEKAASEIDEEVAELVNLAYRKGVDSLKRNKAFILEAHQCLLKTETIGEEEIRKLWKQFARSAPKLIRENTETQRIEG
jgi:cell division protease FtsH